MMMPPHLTRSQNHLHEPRVCSQMSQGGARPRSRIGSEKGIAVILALTMLLVMSVLATTIAFMSNVDFQSMSSFRRGQEALLAAEHCIQEIRRTFEGIGIEIVFFNVQGGTSFGPSATLDDGSYCRTGTREWTNPDTTPDGGGGIVINSVKPPFVEVPDAVKSLGRPLKDVSLPSGGVGGAALVPVTVVVTGKDANDKDLDDLDDTINTGVEIAVGFETFIPGGASNVY